jgi:hypothetical protein
MLFSFGQEKIMSDDQKRQIGLRRRFGDPLFHLSVKKIILAYFFRHKQSKFEIWVEVYDWNKQQIQKYVNYVQQHIKIKESCNRPGVTQRVPGGLGYQISITFGTWRWWGKPHPPATFTSRKCFWYSFLIGAELTPGPWYGRKEICPRKIQWHHWGSIPGPSD